LATCPRVCTGRVRGGWSSGWNRRTGFVVSKEVGARLFGDGGSCTREENALVGVVDHAETEGLAGIVVVALSLTIGSRIHSGRL